MSFCIGDKVRFLNDIGEAEVMESRGEEVHVMRDDGFDAWYPQQELVRIDRDDLLAKSVYTQEIRPKDQEVIQVSKSQTFTPSSNVMEVDLHIHNLVDNERLVSKDKMLDIQMYHARRAIDEARLRKVRRLVLIHGVGQGVLRTSIMKLLDGYDRVQYYDASYQKYGKGATEVEFW